MDKLLTPKEVAEILNLSIWTVYDYLQAGTLKSMRLGTPKGPYRIKESDLESFINGKKNGNSKLRNSG